MIKRGARIPRRGIRVTPRIRHGPGPRKLRTYPAFQWRGHAGHREQLRSNNADEQRSPGVPEMQNHGRAGPSFQSGCAWCSAGNSGSVASSGGRMPSISLLHVEPVGNHPQLFAELSERDERMQNRLVLAGAGPGNQLAERRGPTGLRAVGIAMGLMFPAPFPSNYGTFWFHQMPEAFAGQRSGIIELSHSEGERTRHYAGQASPGIVRRRGAGDEEKLCVLCQQHEKSIFEQGMIWSKSRRKSGPARCC